MRKLSSLNAAALAALLLASATASADEVAEFYKGKTLTIVVGHQTGTGYDLYARTLARYFGRHIPGNPQVLVQNMNGASGLAALNWLANKAPKDGTAIATMVFTAPFEPLFGAGKGKFDATKFLWVGNLDSSVAVCGASRKSGVTSFKDLFDGKTLLVGGTGQTGPFRTVPTALKNLLEIPGLKVVSGYKGSMSVKLAIQTGELGGACGPTMSTVRANFADLWKAGDFKIIVQAGVKPHPDPALKDVPHIYSFARSDETKKIFDMIFGMQSLGRPYMGPAGIPDARGKALQKAFMDTARDPAFVAEAKKANLELDPEAGPEVAALVARIYGTPKPLADKARAAMAK
ncbi:MAG: Bug family tripartite tricarboxylate transporter substrate binding protein [Beijerinckiaceae bacterium]